MKTRFLASIVILTLCSPWHSTLADDDAAAASSTSEALYRQRFDAIRLAQSYASDVERGFLRRSHTVDGFEATFHYALDVPDTYEPSRKMDLHIYLHGGVGISSNRISNRTIRRLKRLRVGDAISVYPSAWSAAKWWYESQAQNIPAIIRSVKEVYNVDDNRVFLHGLSDGASGAYYFASHLPTPFAGFIALVGSPHVLRPKHNVFGTTFAGNLVNKPIFAINTEDDHLFPAESVERLFEVINQNNGNVTFHSMPGDHFGMPWLSPLQKAYENFVSGNTRNPYPDWLYWQIGEGDAFNRVHWLVLHGARGGDAESAVVAEKKENAVYLRSRNVSAATLLISSDHFDLSSAIRVWVNGELVFDQKVSPDVRVLEKWFKRDHDRSMLFAAEVYLDLPQ